MKKSLFIYTYSDNCLDSSVKDELNGEEFSINKKGKCIKDCPKLSNLVLCQHSNSSLF